MTRESVGLATLARAMAKCDDFVICGHIGPDGDCIGSQLALWHALKSLGKTATCLLAKPGSIDKDLLFLPGASQMVPFEQYAGNPRACIAVDLSDPSRLGEGVEDLFHRAQQTFIVDHHETIAPPSDFAHIDTGAASTTMLVWELIDLLRAVRTADIANCCYTGLLTDTGRFQFQNTDARALNAAASMVSEGANPSLVARELFQNVRLTTLRLERLMLDRMEFGAKNRFVVSYLKLEDFANEGAVKSDADPLINVLRSIEGVQVACLLRETEDSVRGSFRAKNEIDVEELAREFGGGGHKAAAGFTLYEPMDKAFSVVKDRLNELFAGIKNV